MSAAATFFTEIGRYRAWFPLRGILPTELWTICCIVSFRGDFLFALPRPGFSLLIFRFGRRWLHRVDAYLRLRLAFTAKYAMQVTWIRILPGRFARNFSDSTLGTRLIFHFTKLGRHSPLSKYRCSLRVPSVFATLQTRDEYLFGFKQLHTWLFVKIKRAPAHS